MTLSLTLSEIEDRRLREHACANGTTVDAYLRNWIASLPELTREKGDPTVALLDRWDAEDDAMTDEERAKAAADYARLEATLSEGLRLRAPEL